MLIKPKFHTPPSNEAWVYTYIKLYIKKDLDLQIKNGHKLLPHPDGPDEQLVLVSNKLLLFPQDLGCRCEP